MIDVLADDATRQRDRRRPTPGWTATRRGQRIVADLEARGDLEASEAPRDGRSAAASAATTSSSRASRPSGSSATGPLAERALRATRSGRTTIVPGAFEKVWEHWLTNIHDWNVSRQLWWGHRIPAWYCPDGHVTVSAAIGGPGRVRRPAAGPPPSCARTPTSSTPGSARGLWPFSTLGWPDRHADLRRYYPTSVMETGYDIIFFWVARMMMLGLHLTDAEPFHTVYLHGLVRDPHGKKMSKTKGNVVDPLEVIDETGADALRFALIHGAAPGQRPALRAGQARGRPQLREQAVERHALRRRRRPGVDRRPTPTRGLPGRAPPRPGRALDPVARRGDGRRRRRARSPTTTFGEVDAHACTTRSGASSATGAWSWPRSAWPTTSPAGRGPRGDLVDARRGAGHVPAAAPPGHAVRDRGALGAPCRIAADDPDLLIVARWPAAAERDAIVEAEVDGCIELVARTAQCARRGAHRAGAPGCTTRARRPARHGRDVRGAAPGPRAMARARPLLRRLDRAASLTADPGPSRSSPGISRPSSSPRSRILRRTARPPIAPVSKGSSARPRRLLAARERLANEAFTSKAPPAVVEGARAREAELADQVERLRERLSDEAHRGRILDLGCRPPCYDGGRPDRSRGGHPCRSIS